MLNKIKSFIEKCYDKRFHRFCYKMMDEHFSRTYTLKGVCAGIDLYNPEQTCLECPYFRDIRDNDDWA